MNDTVLGSGVEQEILSFNNMPIHSPAGRQQVSPSPALKNPAYGRHSISRHVQIVATLKINVLCDICHVSRSHMARDT